MNVSTQVAEQRKVLEQAIAQALELAKASTDSAEVAVTKTTGIGVSTRYGEVENVEFNSDGALGITVYHQNRKGSASSTDLSPDAIRRTVQAAIDIARYTSPIRLPARQMPICWLMTHPILIFTIRGKLTPIGRLNWRRRLSWQHSRRINVSPIPKAAALTAMSALKYLVTAMACYKATVQAVIRFQAA